MDVPSQPAAPVPARKPLMPLEEALARMLAGMQPVAAGDLAEVEMGALGSLSCRFSG